MIVEDSRIIKTKQERIDYAVEVLRLGFEFFADARSYLKNNKLYKPEYEEKFQLCGQTLMDLAKDVKKSNSNAVQKKEIISAKN